MNPTAKLLYISLLLAGVAIVSSSNGRTKRYAQEPQNPGTNPIQNLFNGISDHFQRMIDRLGNRYSDPTNSSPLRNWISGFGRQRNGSMVLDELLRRMNATWNQGLSRLNTTLSSRNFQLLRDLLRLRNASDSNQRIRIDGLLQRILSDLNERLSSSNMNVPSEILQELRQFIRNGMERHRNATQELGRLLLRIHSLMDQGIIRALSGSVSGENGLSLGGSSTSGEGSLSASGSGESGSISGSVSSGSGENGGTF